VSYPSWAGLNNTSMLPGDHVKISAVDINKQIQAGSTNVVLATITVKGDAVGSTSVVVDHARLDNDTGYEIQYTTVDGGLVVYSSLVADFSANVTSGVASSAVPLVVGFTDLSVGSPAAASWIWNFGDGQTSTEQNPVHSYLAAGTYTVTLSVTNQYTGDVKVKTGYIVVKSYVEIFPGYTSLPTDLNGDGLYEDTNGNGRLDFDDVVTYYQNMDWVSANTNVGITPYDYNANGRIDFDDIVTLYQKLLEAI
jgi:PKD repeat protein